MRLNIVSRPIAPGPDFPGTADLNVPGSVEGWRFLLESGLPSVPASTLLEPRDYQSAWEEGARAVWSISEGPPADPTPGNRPDTAIDPYPLFLLLSQTGVLWRAFEELGRRFSVTEVSVGPPEDDDREPYLFYFTPRSAYFHDVARAWAAHRGLPVRVQPRSAGPANGGDGRPKRSWRSRRVELRCLWRSKTIHLLRENILTRWIARAQHAAYRWAGGRDVLFFLPQNETGLHWPWPSFVRDARPLMETEAPGAPPAPPAPPPSLGPVFEILRPLIERRWREHSRAFDDRGESVRRKTQGVLDALLASGRRAAFVAVGVSTHDQGAGHVAAVFKRAGCPAAGLQHGGNQGAVVRGAVPLPFMEGGADGIFFSWGKGRCDELASYGIESRLRFIQTGSPRMQSLWARSRGRPGPRTGRVLYAPTLVNVATTLGVQPPWDTYVPLVLEVCRRLNEMKTPAWVKILDRPEMDALGLDRFENLVLLRRGSFADYMSEADVLLVDSLGGSPVYEAMATDRPILLYAGMENQQWDPAMLAALERRARVARDRADYLRAVDALVRNPAAVGGDVPPDGEFRERFLTPAAPGAFWETVRRTLFDRPAGEAP